MRAHLWAALACALAATPLLAETIDCRVVAIADGDTLTCLTVGKRQIKVRLAEIDTPEKAQPYGTRSRQALSELVFGKQVQLHVQDTDRYGRTVARVSVDRQDVNREMVNRGAAWVYRAYNKDRSLLQVEAEAKAGRRGLWGLPETDRTPPWEWRKAGRLQSIAKRPAAADTRSAQCGTKRYCREMVSCEDARFHLEHCGLTALDGDRDGKPCETVCR